MSEVVPETLSHPSLVPGVVAGHPGHALASLAPGQLALAPGVVGPSVTLTTQVHIGRTGGTCGVG